MPDGCLLAARHWRLAASSRCRRVLLPTGLLVSSRERAHTPTACWLPRRRGRCRRKNDAVPVRYADGIGSRQTLCVSRIPLRDGRTPPAGTVVGRPVFGWWRGWQNRTTSQSQILECLREAGSKMARIAAGPVNVLQSLGRASMGRMLRHEFVAPAFVMVMRGRQFAGLAGRASQVMSMVGTTVSRRAVRAARVFGPAAGAASGILRPRCGASARSTVSADAPDLTEAQ